MKNFVTLSSSSYPVGIGTVFILLTGCRGIAGPFPPPLWIRVSYWDYVLRCEFTIAIYMRKDKNPLHS